MILEPAARSKLVARTTPVPADGDILDWLAPGGFAYLSPERAIVTGGVAAAVDPADAVALLAAVPHDAPANAPAPLAVGALPFTGAGRLVVPARLITDDGRGARWCTSVEPADAPPALHVAGLPPSRFTVAPLSTREEWHDAVQHALARIERGELGKVVLARAVRIEADEPFDARAVLAELRRTQPGCTAYADGDLVGATPELLVRKRGESVLARPLAGTGSDADALTRSAKDRREHEFVVDAVAGALRARCQSVEVDGPRPIVLADVSHLATTIAARCADHRASAVDLAGALHPTPAVGGVPRPAALDTIAELERVPRDRYAGPCGWVDAHGDGEFVIALRGARLDGASAVLHAGAGIVDGSEPDAEWAETQQKLEPMIRALVRP